MMHRVSALLRALCMALALGLTVMPLPALRAQEAAGAPSASVSTSDTVDARVSRLSDKEVRDLLLQELGAKAERDAQDGGPALLAAAIASPLQHLATQLRMAVATVPDRLTAVSMAIDRYADTLGGSGSLRFLFALAAALLIALGVESVITRRMTRSGTSPGGGEVAVPQFPGSIPYLATRFFRDAVGALVSLVAASLVVALVLPERETRVALHIALWLFFFPRIAAISLRFFLSPRRPDLRLVHTDDRTARILLRNLVGVFVVVGLLHTVILIMHEVGMVTDAEAAGFWVGVVVYIWLSALVIRCRSGLRQIVRGGQRVLTPGELWLVAAYPAFALTVIFATWVKATLAPFFGREEVVQDGRHLVILGLLLVAPMCDALIRSVARIFVPPMRGTGEAAQDAYDAAWRSYIRIARVLVFGATLLVLAKLWGMSLVDFANAGVGDHLGEKVVVATLILIAGFVLREIVSLTINRKLADMQPDVASSAMIDPEEHGPVASGASSRAGTILPPVSWTLQAVIVIVTILTALAELGVNVTALVAGAGVAGIAIGFGAQKLVANLVSGIFFLLDDAFRINEYISTGTIDGTVEKIAMQSMHLRQSDGALHCVPYSNIDTVTNFSRDWGTTKMVFTVPFDTDIDQVRRIFKRIGQDLASSDDYKDAFLQPFKYKGVSQVNDVGIVVNGKFMFRPELGKQFVIRREIFRRVQSEFARANIQFARREVRVTVGANSAPVDSDELQRLGAAAAETAAGPGLADKPLDLVRGDSR